VKKKKKKALDSQRLSWDLHRAILKCKQAQKPLQLCTASRKKKKELEGILHMQQQLRPSLPSLAFYALEGRKGKSFFYSRKSHFALGQNLLLLLRDNSLNFAYSFPATIFFFFFSPPLALSAKWRRIYEEGGIDLQLEKNFMTCGHVATSVI
jgi:hypothetical protein